MAVTVSAPFKTGVFGDLKYVIVDITFDNSYPTGGEPVTPAQVGLDAVYGVTTLGNTYDAQGAVVVSYDRTNSKLVAYGGDGAAAGVTFLKEIPNATDLSTITSSLIFVGK
jgi:hypothetical protein